MLVKASGNQTELHLSTVRAIERDTHDLLDLLDQNGLSEAAAHMSMTVHAIALWIKNAAHE